ncbi:MAG TPA: hypothetical protein VNH18_23955 [Bryobacteraceae bacterium]|nr:hypothetical protein [Bryobacteraceae bacterium]
MARPVVLIHGYSASSTDFDNFIPALTRFGIDAVDINICNYVSLSNEITIKDIAEGLDRAFRQTDGLSIDEPFDAIVHSTGMLVIRCWLTAYGAPIARTRLKRLKHLIGVAPATWGSPQAHKGRTWLGALVKGNRQMGPDFMEAGDQVLDGLELGSRFTWDLAHADLLGDKPCFDAGAETPWIAVFIGNQPYQGLPSAANDPGTDGTVRWAGCGLNTRKISIDLTRTATDRVSITPWGTRLDVPPIAVDGKNHGTIVQQPDDGMMQRIGAFLKIEQTEQFNAWLADALEWSAPGMKQMQTAAPGDAGGITGKVGSALSKLFHPTGATIEGWQQFVVHACDERGDPITDFMIEIEWQDTDGTWEKFEQMYTNVHAYSTDPSFRCFHIRLGNGLSASKVPLRARISAHTGTQLVAYQGYGSDGIGRTMQNANDPADQAVTIDLQNNLGQQNGSFFYPFTTTLVEIILNREPFPLDGQSALVNLRRA